MTHTIQVTNKKWTKEEVTNILLTSDKDVWASLKKLYSYQTADEQNTDSTRHRNGVGFTGYDAKVMTSLAKSYLKYGHLTPKQTALTRKKILKYAGQLAKIANGEL